MTPEEFDASDPLLDSIAEQVGGWMESDASAELREALAQLSKQLNGLSVSLDLTVGVFDPDRGNLLPLLQTGLSSSDGKPAYQTHADSTPMRYLANGEMTVVPHDRCPCCRAAWDFKELHSACPSCGVKLGEEVKLLIDSNVCPHCENGSVTPAEPKCDECGFAVNPAHVAWG